MNHSIILMFPVLNDRSIKQLFSGGPSRTRTGDLRIGPYRAIASGPDRIRTGDLSIANAALYQLSYRPLRAKQMLALFTP
jgi:hypothetical protein